VASVLETPSLQVLTNHVFAAMAGGADKEKIEARHTARGRRRVPASVFEQTTFIANPLDGWMLHPDHSRAMSVPRSCLRCARCY
jgi:hypothetical protein